MPCGTIITAIAIDDVLVTAQTPKTMDDFYTVMKKKYDINRLSMQSTYLGCHSHYYDDGTIALSQRLEVDKTLTHADIIRCNGIHTPFSSNIDYDAHTCKDAPLPDRTELYRKLVGDLRYMVDSKRPDITFFVSRLVTAMVQLTTRHWTIMKAALRYISKTRKYGIHFMRRRENSVINATTATKQITSCADADWANDKKDLRSVTGGFFTWHGISIGWFSKKQTMEVTSIAKSE